MVRRLVAASLLTGIFAVLVLPLLWTQASLVFAPTAGAAQAQEPTESGEEHSVEHAAERQPRAIPQWIWADPSPKAGQTAYFRTTFRLDEPVRHAELRCAADRRMSIVLNARHLGDAENYQQMARFDAAPLLHKGTNILAVKATSEGNTAGVVLVIDIELESGALVRIVSNDAWFAALKEPNGWNQLESDRDQWFESTSFGALGVLPWGDPTGEVDDYNQWKKALGTEGAVDPTLLSYPPGFEVELVRSARSGEGSWISLAFDPRGRIIVAREDKGLLRMTLLRDGRAETQVESVDDTLRECRGLLWAYDSLYVNANNSQGLYRLRDTDGDDRFDEVKLLRATGGGVGHGRNDLVLGPDGAIYLIHGDDVLLPTDFDPAGSPHAHYELDRLLPCRWNQFLQNYGTIPPAGHVIRTDRDGRTWQLMAGGFRNPYGIDFNSDGEMFTYDADMEWDVGAPWYRPTRVNHIVSGGDYGWRQGSFKWPAFYPDSLPSNLDIGLGSPTAVRFGYRSQFPSPYREALYILDWAYGRIIAVHMKPRGASYECTAESFIKGRPLNVTDLEIGPDGAMYFLTGGRGTQSGLYRVRYTGPQVDPRPPTAEEIAAAEQAAQARALRHRLEAFHGGPYADAIGTAWPHLDSDDVWIRHAARVAVEFQPLTEWREMALAEKRPTARTTALLALARMETESMRPRVIAAIADLPWEELSAEQQTIALRAAVVCLARMHDTDSDSVTALRKRLAKLYPASKREANELLCELLVFLDEPTVVAKTLPLIAAAPTQPEKLHYLYMLRAAKSGWTLADRATYIQWLREGERFAGAHLMPRFIQWIREDAAETLSDAERQSLSELLAPAPPPTEAESPLPNRHVIKQWQLNDLADALPEVDRGRSFDGGKAMYAAALCARCHRMATEGTPLGPDLTDVARRFGRRDILISILDPSRVVDEKYRGTSIVTHDGKVIVGQVTGEEDGRVLVASDPLQPQHVIAVPKDEIELQAASPTSPMPAGLLDTLSLDEILDLLAYIESGGDPGHPSFQGSSPK